VHLFLLNELDSTLVVLRRDGDRFVRTHLASTLPAGITEHNQTSAVRVSHSGKSVLVSNRGYNSIAVFEFDPRKHAVTLRTVEPTRGREPRDFIQSTDGGTVIVGNQDSDTLVTFAFDEAAAALDFTHEIDVPTPVCLRLVP
jgi:6-phosphogluconolactonase